MEIEGRSRTGIVVAGHIAIDYIIDSGDQVEPRKALGGAPSYSSLALSSLGYRNSAVTKVGTDFPQSWAEFLAKKGGVNLSESRIADARTTSFRIDRTIEPRKLYLLARCKELSVNDFKEYMGKASSDIVVLNPIAGEISLSLLDRISKEFEFVLVDSQGFVRRISPRTSEVSMHSGLDISSLSGVDLLKADREELAAWSGSNRIESSIRQVSRFVDYILVPSGAGRVDLFERGKLRYRTNPQGVDVRDTTGAGDILLAVFAARYSESEDIRESLAFSVSAANLSVRRFGIEKALLSKEEVGSRADRIEVETF